MNIRDFGQNSFVTWTTGLIERIEMAKESKFLKRLNRWSAWSKEKRQRFHNRYCKWLMHFLKKPFVEDIEGYHLRIQLQQHLEKATRIREEEQ